MSCSRFWSLSLSDRDTTWCLFFLPLLICFLPTFWVFYFGLLYLFGWLLLLLCSLLIACVQPGLFLGVRKVLWLRSGFGLDRGRAGRAGMDGWMGGWIPGERR